MNKIIALAFVATTFVSGLTQAETYFGGMVTRADLNAAGMQGNSHYDAQLLVGQRVHENFAIEARGGRGMDAEKIAGSDVHIRYIVGGYLKAIAPLDLFDAYALAGATRTKLDGGVNMSVNSASYGAGVSVEAAKDVDVFVEYLRLYKKDHVSSNGLSLGFNFSSLRF